MESQSTTQAGSYRDPADIMDEDIEEELRLRRRSDMYRRGSNMSEYVSAERIGRQSAYTLC